MGEAGGVRPPGRLVWLHLGPGVPSSLAHPLLAQLHEEEEDVALLMTTEPGARPPHRPEGVAAALAVPADHPPFARAFLDHWRPDVCVWASGALRPALMDAAMARMPLVVAGARAVSQPGGAFGSASAVLGRVARVLALDLRDAQAWRRLGVPAGRVEVAGLLQVCAPPPPDDEAARRVLTPRLAGRPLWFAPAVPEVLAAVVLDAHRAVLRHTHRALLVLEPAGAAPRSLDPKRTARQDGPIDDVHEIVLLDGPARRGLWYRMAPVTLLADSLVPGSARVDPDAPASLGSALVHGSHHGDRAMEYARLLAEGASLEIAGPGGAGPAVETLLVPDRAARQSHAAWSVVTRGAAATDRLAATLFEVMDG